MYANTGVSVPSTATDVASGLISLTTSTGTCYALVSGTTCTTTGLSVLYTSGRSHRPSACA